MPTFFSDLQDRCRKAQFSVAGKRAKFGNRTDEFQKLFLAIVETCGGLSKIPSALSESSATPPKIQTAMQRVETVISGGSVTDLDNAIHELVLEIRAAWEAANNSGAGKLMTDEQYRDAQRPADVRAFHKAMAESFRRPFIDGSGDLEKYQRENPVKK